MTIAFLIIVGGLGFAVHHDLFSGKKQKTLHTKLVVLTTLFLLLGGTLVIFLLERYNPQTLAGMSLSGQWLNAFFQSATSRTAGYLSFSQAQMTDMGALMTILLMFVGGSPGSTAGGIKTTTLAVLVLSTFNQIRGRDELEVFNRTISKETIIRATTIIILSLFWVLLVSSLITLIEDAAYLPVLYETVSAFGTVGLTMDLTPSLESSSKVLLILSMYMGRLGPITLAYALFQSKKHKTTTSASGKVMIG